ncbi:hypothetical protein CPB86DRAFT_733207 [Serendipita vermifera]|nr:hypothetical protein CPB86DRAFT_733207 [Serendipita vermifera]
MESDTTSHPRPSLLTSFLSRSSRPRSTATSPTGAEAPGLLGSNGAVQGANTGASSGNTGRRRTAGGQSGQIHTVGGQPVFAPPSNTLPTMPGPTATSFSQMLRRRRSNNGNLAQAAAGNNTNPNSAAAAATHGSVIPPPGGQGTHGNTANGSSNANSSAPNPANFGPAHRIRLVPHLENQRALHFDPITRECREGAPPIRIGRFTDRSGTLAASTNSLTGKIAFKSKVVSRGHAELWCETNGKFYVKDTSSSSGTFLNHMRLSQAGIESRPYQLKDGDILQLGVDYQGGTEEIYRCVKIRIEIGREWQAGPNPFNTNALAQLKALSNLPASSSAPAVTGGRTKVKKTSVSDCCICLFPVTVCQALFIAPCSHSFHYKCIRSTLYDHHPGFSCPLCRSFHNLEADVEVELQEEEEEWEDFPGNDEPNATHIPEPAHPIEPEAEAEASLAHHAEPAAMDTTDGAPNGSTGHVRRSVDDDDDIPLGFRTAAEDNDRRVLLPSNQSHTNVASAPSNSMQRRPPRRGTMIQGNTPDDIDHGFETDGGVVGYNAETDMDIDEPTRMGNQVNGNHRSNSNSRNGSARNRATVYNHPSTGAQPGVGSTPNLHRPGSALAHPLNNSTGLPGTTTPPIITNSSSPQPMAGGAYMSPVNIRANPHALAQSSSNPGAARAGMTGSFGSLPTNGGGSSHLFGDAGTAPMIPDKDRPHDDAMSGEEHGMEPAHPSTLFGFGSKRKR